MNWSYKHLKEKLSRLDMNNIFFKISTQLEVQHSEVIGKSRKREFADARKIGIKICIDILNEDRKFNCKHGFSAIGVYLNVGHSDIIHLYNKCNDYIDTNKEFRAKYGMCLPLKNEFINDYKQLKQTTE